MRPRRSRERKPARDFGFKATELSPARRAVPRAGRRVRAAGKGRGEAPGSRDFSGGARSRPQPALARYPPVPGSADQVWALGRRGGGVGVLLVRFTPKWLKNREFGRGATRTGARAARRHLARGGRVVSAETPERRSPEVSWGGPRGSRRGDEGG